MASNHSAENTKTCLEIELFILLWSFGTKILRNYIGIDNCIQIDLTPSRLK